MKAGMKMDSWFYIVMAVIVVVFGIFPMARFLYSSVYPYLKDGFTQDTVLKKGTFANADIISALQTSGWGGSKPIYILTLRFKTHEGVLIEASTMKALSFKEIESFKEGNQTTIKYDPADPKKIAIYDRPLILGE